MYVHTLWVCLLASATHPHHYLEFEIGFAGGVDSSGKGVDRGLVGGGRAQEINVVREYHMGHVMDETVMDCRIG